MDAATLQAVVRFVEKRATEPPVWPPPATTIMPPDQVNQQMVSDLGKAVMVAGGLGMSARAIQGLVSMASRNLSPVETPESRIVMPMPVPKTPRLSVSQPRRRGLPAPQVKAANSPYDIFVQPLVDTVSNNVSSAGSWLKDKAVAGAKQLGTSAKDTISDAIDYSKGRTGATVDEAKGTFKGEGLTGPSDHPLYYGGLIGAGGAAMYGGYRLTDAILNARRQRELDDEVEQARGQFQQALRSQTDPAAKIASDGSLADGLDQLYSLWSEKRAEPGAIPTAAPADATTPLWNASTSGKALGYYGAYAVPAFGLAAWLGSDWQKAHSNRAVLDKALRERERQRALQEPEKIHAIPVGQTGDFEIS